MSLNNCPECLQVYEQLRDHFGEQDWWPGDSPFEIMVGAILTQNTAWTNVEKAIANLKTADCLSAEKIDQLPHDKLAEMIRPSGYFNIKAKRLQAFCAWYLVQESKEAIAMLPTDELRQALLTVHGVGPETADDMLLYAFNRPVFVIDAYTRRLFSRLAVIGGKEDYDTLRALFESSLTSDVSLFSEYHALIINQGKDYCRVKPQCEACPLSSQCRYISEC